MPREKDNVLESNQYMKSDKMPYIIYADIESSIKKTDGWANDSEKSLTTKICEHIPCGYSVSTTWSFGNIENKAYFISWGKLHEKILYFFKRTCYECN